MFGGLAQLATSRRRLSAMSFSTTLSTTLSTEKQGLLAINRERILSDSKGFIRSGRRWEMHFPRFGTERSEVRILSPRHSFILRRDVSASRSECFVSCAISYLFYVGSRNQFTDSTYESSSQRLAFLICALIHCQSSQRRLNLFIAWCRALYHLLRPNRASPSTAP